MLRLIILVLIVIALICAVPAWPYNRGRGYYATGGVGALLLVVLMLMLLGVI